MWRNRLARSAVNRKVGGSSPPRDDIYFFTYAYPLLLIYPFFLIDGSQAIIFVPRLILPDYCISYNDFIFRLLSVFLSCLLDQEILPADTFSNLC